MVVLLVESIGTKQHRSVSEGGVRVGVMQGFHDSLHQPRDPCNACLPTTAVAMSSREPLQFEKRTEGQAAKATLYMNDIP